MLRLMGVAIDKLHTDLLGKSKLNFLAVRGPELGHALLHRFRVVFNLRLTNTLLLSKDLAGDSGQSDGLIDTGFYGLGIPNTNLNINWCDNRNVVSSFLSNLLAVLVTIGLVSMSISWLAHSDHLSIGLLHKRHLNSFCGGVFIFLLVIVGAHLIGDGLSRLCAYGAAHIIAVLSVHHTLNSQHLVLTHGLKSRGTDFSNLNNILNSAVVLGVLITISRISRRSMVIPWSWLVAIGLRMVRLRRGRVGTIRGRWVTIDMAAIRISTSSRAWGWHSIGVHQRENG